MSDSHNRAQHNGLDETGFLHSVLASLPSLVAYMDLELRYLYVNSAYEKWFGVTKEQCLRSTMQDIIGEAGLEAVRPQLEAAYRGQVQNFEREVPYKFGGRRSIHVQYIPDRGEDGLVRGITVIVNDISDRRRAESEKNMALLELRAKEITFDSIINSHSSAIFAFDTSHRFTLVNDEMAALSGLRREEMLGKNLHEIWPKEKADRLVQINQEVLNGTPCVTQEEVVRRSDNAKCFLITTKFPMRNDAGVIIGMGGISVDVTELKRTEQKLQKALADGQAKANEDIEDLMDQNFDRHGHWLDSASPISPDLFIERAQTMELISNCLERLPTVQKMAFMLKEVEEELTDHICSVLEITTTNLGVLLFRARNQLRECIDRKSRTP